MKILSYILIALGISGCATDKGWHWEKSNGDQQSFNIDHAQCRAQGLAGTGGMVTWGTLMIMDACMQGKGWYKVNNI